MYMKRLRLNDPNLHACMHTTCTHKSHQGQILSNQMVTYSLNSRCVCDIRALWWSKGGTVSDVMWQYRLLTMFRYSTCHPLALCRGGWPQEEQERLDCRNKLMIIHSGSLLPALHKPFTYSETGPTILCVFTLVNIVNCIYQLFEYKSLYFVFSLRATNMFTLNPAAALALVFFVL